MTHARRRPRPRRDTKIPRAESIALKSITRLDLALGAYEVHDVDTSGRPRTRGECGDERPCPWASCRHHTALDVDPENGTIKINRPDLEIWELENTCSLDVADAGGHTLEVTGLLLNLTRERARQLETRALLRLRSKMTADELAALSTEGVHHLEDIAIAPHVDGDA